MNASIKFNQLFVESTDPNYTATKYVNMHDLGIEYHDIRTCKDKGKIVCNIAQHVAELVAEAKRPYTLFTHNLIPLSLSFFFWLLDLV